MVRNQLPEQVINTKLHFISAYFYCNRSGLLCDTGNCEFNTGNDAQNKNVKLDFFQKLNERKNAEF